MFQAFQTLISRVLEQLVLQVREEIIKNLDSLDAREAVSKLFSAIETNNLDGFHDAMSLVSSPAICSLNLKVPDKKQRLVNF